MSNSLSCEYFQRKCQSLSGMFFFSKLFTLWCLVNLRQYEHEQQLADAEKIGKVQITNQSMNSITISWEQPEDPNGQISMYSVEYQNIDIENSRPYSECVNAKGKNKTVVYTISTLFAGNYR
nr:insulin-like receptor [Leptinotarsa decemlineata]